ncbi:MULTISPECIES: hotdog fold thioesterase [Bacillus]|uniref:hotdog fold thioesterase n=1 Tax=Bacillus TaxID=1386 RepID=UPI000BA5628C|nr:MULTISPECIES: hotdog fold thioesterase [Bacillus]MBG9816495.1 esterase [Bacillus safensis]MCM3026345.1 hotdog fold thioesterase [Bacillus safensis]MCY1117805.1 hotdog fold thioesterase [Bacillus safensis]MDI0273634.1 hotdog fold thioesterase [Bacillus safensis]MEB2270948.1 hotdog fold thioesterase [Bacillus safensis]
MDVSGSNTLLEALGIEIVECNESRCVATMPVDHRTKQPFGLLHGGASAALAETVASMGAAAHLDLTQQVCSGIEINANHLKSVRDGVVTATAVPVHVGRRTMVFQIDIKDDRDRHICTSRCTLAVIDRI